MKEDLYQFLLDFKLNIEEIENEFVNQSYEKLTSKVLICCKSFIQNSKLLYDDHCRHSKENQIFFFKYLKPEIHSTFEFYRLRLSIIHQMPEGSKKMKKDYINKKIFELNEILKMNTDFHRYIQSESNSLDEVYFTECTFDDVITEIDADLCVFENETLSSRNDRLLTRYLVAKKLIKFCQSISLNNYQTEPKEKKKKLVWSRRAVDFSELVISLANSGAFNNGNAKLSDIHTALSEVIEFPDNTNLYDNVRNIKNRKLGYSKFIGILEDSLEKYIVDSDKN